MKATITNNGPYMCSSWIVLLNNKCLKINGDEKKYTLKYCLVKNEISDEMTNIVLRNIYIYM